MTVYVVEGSGIYHRDRRCRQVVRKGAEAEPLTLKVRPKNRSGSGMPGYSPCHICAVEP